MTVNMRRKDENNIKKSNKVKNNNMSIVEAHELITPHTAWITVILFLVTLSCYIISCIYLYDYNKYLCCFVCGWLLFILFTPMHDSAHRSITKIQFLNDSIGRICAFLYCAPFHAFRYVHLEHHKHTNDINLDPDMWSSRNNGPAILFIFKWMSQELHYYVPYFSQIFKGKRSRNEVIEAVFTIILCYTIVFYLISLGYFNRVLFCYLIPIRIAVLILAYSFDFLPHSTQTNVKRSDNYMQTTVRIIGFNNMKQWYSDYILSPIMLYQNYHNIHHLYPTLPFYRYPSIWWKHRKEFLSRGAVERDFISSHVFFNN